MIRRFSSRSVLAAVLLASLALAGRAEAQVPIYDIFGGPQGYGRDCLPPNDDGSSPRIDITSAFPSGLRFFSGTYTSLFVNTNGNITFAGALGTYTPRGFPVANQPMIAPYWADVDIRSSEHPSDCEDRTENGVWWHQQPGLFIATWDEVGYFSSNIDLRMTFQLLIRASDEACGGGTDFDVEFRFNRCEWETGDASGGSGGFGGTPAQSGFDEGIGAAGNYIALPGSLENGIATRMCDESNVGMPGIWRFQVRSGGIICPDAGDSCDTGMMGVCRAGAENCVGDGVQCFPLTPASDERCDTLDNDCDGMVDENTASSPVCASGFVCNRGACVPECFEGGCDPDETCTSAGACEETVCLEVECPAGERCVGGACQPVCEGVTCPSGQACRAGRCVDACEGVICDEGCTVCDAGECVGRCDLEGSIGCDEGEVCRADGLCVSATCSGVTCPPGFVCVDGGGCVDPCIDVVCPMGEICVMGACELAFEQDAGVGETDGGMSETDGGSVETDAGSDTDDGGGVEADAGETETDGGPVAPREDSGCSCHAVDRNSTGSSLWFVLMGAVLFWRRRPRS